jgi:hypothetical protein
MALTNEPVKNWALNWLESQNSHKNSLFDVKQITRCGSGNLKLKKRESKDGEKKWGK